MKSILLSLLLFCASHSFSQTNTVGLQKASALASEGYVLFTPERNNDVYLINNCGERVNRWGFNEFPALTCYLLENGNLLRAGTNSLEIRDWGNNVIWSYAMDQNGYFQHHDIQPLPNGNILCVCTDVLDSIDCIAQGRKPELTESTVVFEKIVELKPIGVDSVELVWEWKFVDHIIQDFDNTKDNYGIVENHPELLDVNFPAFKNSDWIHLNSIHYNTDLDQIIVSARHLNEIYIIDHSTTLIEAAGHTGGNSNKGGDFLWRWGNPQVYRQGTSSDQKLFFQHDARWVNSNYADSGKISVFNNDSGSNPPTSSVDLILPVFSNDNYTMSAGRFLPNDVDFSWSGSIFGNTVYESKKSGWQSQPNGNILICLTSLGQISEITKAGEHLWSYRNPTGTGNLIYNQFDVLSQPNNSIFRGERYTPDFPGFVGKDLTGKGLIENENDESITCKSLDVHENELQNQIIIANPVQENRINFNQEVHLTRLQVYNTNGQLIQELEDFNGIELPISLQNGTYFITYYSNNIFGSQKVIVLK
ncbi:MAG: aryl-sulfate sulfotransferase [Bacteroidota bacterium]